MRVCGLVFLLSVVTADDLRPNRREVIQVANEDQRATEHRPHSRAFVDAIINKKEGVNVPENTESVRETTQARPADVVDFGRNDNPDEADIFFRALQSMSVAPVVPPSSASCSVSFCLMLRLLRQT